VNSLITENIRGSGGDIGDSYLFLHTVLFTRVLCRGGLGRVSFPAYPNGNLINSPSKPEDLLNFQS